MSVEQQEHGLGEWADDSRLAEMARRLAAVEEAAARIEASTVRTEQICDVLLEAAAPFLRGRARIGVLALIARRRT